MDLDPIVLAPPYQRPTPLLRHDRIVLANDMKRRRGDRVKVGKRRVGCFEAAAAYRDCNCAGLGERPEEA
jgi:hypothetical protein